MNKVTYKKIVNKYKKKDSFTHNYLVAFISGGLIGFLSQGLYLIIKTITHISRVNAQSIVTLLIIALASFLTAIGIFDNLIRKYRSGLIIPTTGFAHSVTSSAIDFKKEGLINGIGSNVFHLAGSVILFSVIGSFFLVILKVIISA